MFLKADKDGALDPDAEEKQRLVAGALVLGCMAVGLCMQCGDAVMGVESGGAVLGACVALLAGLGAVYLVWHVGLRPPAKPKSE